MSNLVQVPISTEFTMSDESENVPFISRLRAKIQTLAGKNETTAGRIRALESVIAQHAIEANRTSTVSCHRDSQQQQQQHDAMDIFDGGRTPDVRVPMSMPTAVPKESDASDASDASSSEASMEDECGVNVPI